MIGLLLLACTQPRDRGPAADSFPEGFLWGTATAGFQVDMGCPTWSAARCDDPHSDWYQWVSDPAISGNPGLHVRGEPVSVGPGMWETFEDDVARMKADHMNSYRMSLEWSRLFPDGAAEDAKTVEDLAQYADARAVARYHEMFAALDAAGIEPFVTVNHYTLPLWVHDGVDCNLNPDTCTARGWNEPERIVPLIALFAGWAGHEFGGEVDRWATLNEPFATTLSGYLFPGEDRSAPPGHSFDVDGTVTVMLAQIEGHAAMYDALHTHDDTATVGLVLNMTAMQPARPEGHDLHEADLRGVEHADYLYHGLYLDALTTGAWDPDLDGVPDRTRSDLANRLDFLGINYYNRLALLGLPSSLVEDIALFDFLPDLEVDLFEPYPEGLEHVVVRASEAGVPLYISENGTPYVEDRGVEVLDGHLVALKAAIDNGADVRGYHYWSYIDNYEWNHGMDLRFGLYTFDPITKERSPRAVRDRYAAIARENGL